MCAHGLRTYPARYDDQQDNDQLDGAEEILQSQTPFQRTAMDKEGGCDAGKSNSTLVPPVDLDFCCVQDVFAENDRVRTRPAWKSERWASQQTQSRALRLLFGKVEQTYPEEPHSPHTSQLPNTWVSHTRTRGSSSPPHSLVSQSRIQDTPPFQQRR